MNFHAGLSSHIGKPCPYCNRKMAALPRCQPTRDHVIPKSRGGRDVIIVCAQCNGDKDDMMLAEFYGELKLKGDPRADVIAELVCNACASDVDALADFFADAGRLIAAMSGKRRRARAQRAMETAWNIMEGFNIPRTHWSFAPPNTVKVLARSEIHSLRFDDVHRFRDRVEELLQVAA